MGFGPLAGGVHGLPTDKLVVGVVELQAQRRKFTAQLGDGAQKVFFHAQLQFLQQQLGAGDVGAFRDEGHYQHRRRGAAGVGAEQRRVDDMGRYLGVQLQVADAELRACSGTLERSL